GASEVLDLRWDGCAADAGRNEACVRKIRMDAAPELSHLLALGLLVLSPEPVVPEADDNRWVSDSLRLDPLDESLEPVGRGVGVRECRAQHAAVEPLQLGADARLQLEQPAIEADRLLVHCPDLCSPEGKK